MKRRRLACRTGQVAEDVDDVHAHRLHYSWDQLGTARSGRGRPPPKVDRILHLSRGRGRGSWSLGLALRRQARFAMLEDKYETIEYNTFYKNGVLKLTEVELFFLSSMMTRSSAGQWAVVYLGIGNGERFRYLRDAFFPDLAVIGFDPLDDNFTGDRREVAAAASSWSNDGTNFTFLVRCFEEDRDLGWIRDRIRGRRLLFISDIRGIFLKEDGRSFDKARDQDVQWRAIQCLRPERSLVKFNVPDWSSEFYTYVPGVFLKQTFCFYGTFELRLLIDGVPETVQRYNVWELARQVMYHHYYMRGQAYRTDRSHGKMACLDCCFDCTVLWETVSEYAVKNRLDPHHLLRSLMADHLYTPLYDRRSDVEFYLQGGRLMEACAALDAFSADDGDIDIDWAYIAESLATDQPKLAERLKLSLPRPASRRDLIQVLGSLAEPFALVRTQLNGLIDYPPRYRPTAESDGAVTSEKLRPCWFYSDGACSNGEQCKYKHDSSDPEPCWFFAKGLCSKGKDCPFKHGNGGALQVPDGGKDGASWWRAKPCRFFAQGMCREGDGCSFSHKEDGP